MQTVFVGLSGGVDSAVSAALLKEGGYNVVGAFIKIWSPEFLECTWKEDRLDAMRVCAALQVPFKEIDLSDAYKKEVVGDMLTNYKRGVTPNPDVLCNRSIKFGHFAEWAFQSGADMIATGHYAQIEETDKGRILKRGMDANKDQSYFLYRLGQTDLARILLPVGAYPKPEVRKLAKRFGLPNAKRPDSQGLCFVGDVSMKEFLSRFIDLKQGEVVDEQGRVIGTHDGAALYTLGERHGFSATGGSAHYVVGIDIERNIVRASTERACAATSAVALSAMHWIGERPTFPCTLQAQARYREKTFAVTLEEKRNMLVAKFGDPRIAAPGQSLVLYDSDVCLGGGIIEHAV